MPTLEQAALSAQLVLVFLMSGIRCKSPLGTPLSFKPALHILHRKHWWEKCILCNETSEQTTSVPLPWCCLLEVGFVSPGSFHCHHYFNYWIIPSFYQRISVICLICFAFWAAFQIWCHRPWWVRAKTRTCNLQLWSSAGGTKPPLRFQMLWPILITK